MALSAPWICSWGQCIKVDDALSGQLIARRNFNSMLKKTLLDTMFQYVPFLLSTNSHRVNYRPIG